MLRKKNLSKSRMYVKSKKERVFRQKRDKNIKFLFFFLSFFSAILFLCVCVCVVCMCGDGHKCSSSAFLDKFKSVSEAIGYGNVHLDHRHFCHLRNHRRHHHHQSYDLRRVSQNGHLLMDIPHLNRNCRVSND